MRDSWRHFVAEFVGTFALVFVGSGAIILSKAPENGVTLLHVALAHGLILAVMVTALMRISGHFNTAVTLGFLAARRIEPMMAGLYITAQLLGAIVAAYLLKALFPPALYTAAAGGTQSIAIGISTGQAYLLEGIGAFFLTFVIFGTAVDPRAPKVGGLAIGGTLAAVILAFGPLTGASLNPARSTGPAIAAQSYEGLLIYWGGPIIGAVIAALLYEHVFMRHPVEPADHGAVART